MGFPQIVLGGGKQLPSTSDTRRVGDLDPPKPKLTCYGGGRRTKTPPNGRNNQAVFWDKGASVSVTPDRTRECTFQNHMIWGNSPIFVDKIPIFFVYFSHKVS